MKKEKIEFDEEGTTTFRSIGDGLEIKRLMIIALAITEACKNWEEQHKYHFVCPPIKSFRVKL